MSHGAATGAGTRRRPRLLVTWLIYGAYLHARVTRSWRGSRSAWLLILGFVAVIFTYLGNLFFGGLHSYA